MTIEIDGPRVTVLKQWDLSKHPRQTREFVELIVGKHEEIVAAKDDCWHIIMAQYCGKEEELPVVNSNDLDEVIMGLLIVIGWTGGVKGLVAKITDDFSRRQLHLIDTDEAIKGKQLMILDWHAD